MHRSEQPVLFFFFLHFRLSFCFSSLLLSAVCSSYFVHVFFLLLTRQFFSVTLMCIDFNRFGFVSTSKILNTEYRYTHIYRDNGVEYGGIDCMSRTLFYFLFFILFFTSKFQGNMKRHRLK